MATIGSLFVNLNANTSNFESGMRDASNTSARATQSIRSQVATLASTYREAGMTQSEAMTRAWDEVGRSSTENSNTANNNTNRMRETFRTLLNTMKTFLVYDIGKKLVSGFGDAIKAGVNYNATLETSRLKWETLLGTQEKANKMLKDIEKFAADTPFDKMGVEAMATQLHNAGFEGKALFDQITKFGDMAGAYGIQSDSLQEMVRQYAQVKQAGVAYTEDLNILQDRGVPIYKALAKELGISTAEVKKWTSDGKVSAEVYQKALDSLAKTVEGGMEKQSKSFSGMISTLEDNMGQLAGILAKPIFDFLAAQLQKVMPFVDAVISSLNENGLMGTIQKFAPQAMPYIQAVIGIFNTLKDNVKVVIDAIMGFWNEHKSWLLPLIQFVWTFIATFISQTINAIGKVVQSGLAIIDGIINLFQNLFKGNFQGAWESIKQIFSNAITFTWNLMQVMFAFNLPGMIKNFGANAGSLFSSMWSSIKGFFSGGISGCLNFVRNLFTNASSSFSALRSAGANVFSSLWQVAKNAMSNLLSSVISNIRQVPTNVRSFMTQAVNVIRNINLFTIGKNLIQGLINGIKNMAGNVIGAIGGVVTGAVDAAKRKLGINSPSRVFKEFGMYTGMGLAEGIEGQNKNVLKASQNLSSSVMTGYSTNISSSIKTGLKGNSNGSSNSSGINLNIENFNNNTDKDIEYLANELAFYLKRKNIALGGV